MRFMIWLVSTGGGIACAAWAVPGIWFSGAASGQQEVIDKILPLIGVTLIVGVVSAFVEPIVKLFSLPLIVITVGLFLIVVNALMLMLSAWLADSFGIGFHVTTFTAAVVGSLIITVVTWLIRQVIPDSW